MSIQSNINQMLSTMGVLAAMSPTAERKRRIKQVEVEEEAHARAQEREKADLTTKYTAAKSTLSEKEQSGTKLSPEEREAAILKYQNIGAAGHELFEKFPTAELADEISKSETMLRSLSQKKAKYESMKQRQQEDRARLMEEKRKSEAIRKMIMEV